MVHQKLLQEEEMVIYTFFKNLCIKVVLDFGIKDKKVQF